MIDVYTYKEPATFLKDAWDSKRQRNPHFTVRSWALQMGIKHHASLHEMVNGKRKIPKSNIPKFITSLGLDVNEGLYFELMVDLSRAATAEEKTLYLERMKVVAPIRSKVKFTELESFRMLQDPIHFFICEMALLPDFRPDSSWIQNRLLIESSLERIADAIDRLRTLDILRENPEGKLIRVDQFIHSKSDITDHALQEYHKHLSDIAKKAIGSQPVLEREFQAMSINFDPNRMTEAKTAIRDFLKVFTERFDDLKAPEREICHLNLQFFGITKKGQK